MGIRRKASVLVALSLGAPFCGFGTAHAQTANPFEGDAAAIRAGAAIFNAQCARCHGADAEGHSGPALTPLWEAGTRDDRVFEVVRDGVPGSIMPPSDALDREIWGVVAYLKSISTVPAFSTTGSADRGRGLFEATCVNCHQIRGVGGRMGPDLTRIAQVRSREMLVSSIRDPDAKVARGYRSVTLVTEDGRRVHGAKKGEDAFSLQVMERGDRLQGYIKADLRELVDDGTSPMPSFADERLRGADLEDLLTYLASLREAQTDDPTR